MKTLTNLLLAISFIAIASNAKAQSAFSNEPITAESIVSMMDGQSDMFAISPIMIQQKMEGLAVKWQTVNEKGIASFELEVSGDKKNFTACKKMEAGVGGALYQVDLSSSLLQSEKTYFRVKITMKNGTIGYTDLAAVKVKEVK